MEEKSNATTCKRLLHEKVKGETKKKVISGTEVY